MHLGPCVKALSGLSAYIVVAYLILFMCYFMEMYDA